MNAAGLLRCTLGYTQRRPWRRPDRRSCVRDDGHTPIEDPQDIRAADRTRHTPHDGYDPVRWMAVLGRTSASGPAADAGRTSIQSLMWLNAQHQLRRGALNCMPLLAACAHAAAQISDNTSACSSTVCVAFSCL